MGLMITRVTKAVSSVQSFTADLRGFVRPFKLVESGEICGNCKLEARTYCADCKKSLCRFCVVLLHHPETKGEKHSLEEIQVRKVGVKLLSPILLDLLLVLAASYFLAGSGIDQEYFQGVSYCPALSRARSWLASFDANVFFYYKEPLSKYCDWEDSYWRFFMDTWVRGVLTQSDAWLLLLLELVKAFTFEEFLRVILSPVIGLVYGVVANMVRWLEITLYYQLLEGATPETHPRVFQAEKFVKMISFSDRLMLTGKSKPPPPTLPRKRPMNDWREQAAYQWDRYTRLISFYRAQAAAASSWILRGTLFAATLVRLLCLVTGHTPFLFLANSLGFRSKVAEHQRWFTDFTGIEVGSSQAYLSDWLFVFSLTSVIHSIPGGGEALKAASSLTEGAFRFGYRHVQFALLLTLALMCFGTFKWQLSRQRKNFDSKWKVVRRNLYGDMSREQPCLNWRELRFSDRADYIE